MIGSYAGRPLTRVVAGGVSCLLMILAAALVLGDVARAASGDIDPDNNGWYNKIQLTQNGVQFRAYLEAGDTVTYVIRAGYTPYTNAAVTKFEDISACAGKPSASERDKLKANIQIFPTSDITVTPEKQSKFTLANTDTQIAVSNKSASSTVKTLVFKTQGTDNRARFTHNYKDCGGDSHSLDVTRGFKWRIVVTDKNGHVKQGRVRVSGPLKVWQDTHSDNSVDLNLRYARVDGYRYAVAYPSYQGIYSSFIGSVYGIYTTADKKPFYASINEGQSGYSYDGALSSNTAYLYVDCQGAAVGDCPGNEGEVANKYGGIVSQPIASGTYDIDVIENGATTSNTYYDYSARSGGMLTGGTLHIKYQGMQSGRVMMTVRKADGTALCENREFLIDDANGAGEISWGFGAQDTACESGTLKNGDVSLKINEKVTFTIYANHRGEMHFIATDTESRTGGIGVTTNFNNIPLTHNDAAFDSKPYCGTRNVSGSHHEWTSASGCDAQADPGTAKSTWGNRRVVQDWLWDSQDSATVTYVIGPHYDLTPSTSRDPSAAAVSTGTTVRFFNNVRNSSLMTKANGWEWASYAYVIHGSGNAPNINGGNYTSPNDVCTTNSLTCTRLGGGSGVTATEDGATTLLPTTTFDTSSLRYGDYVCSFLAIRNYYVYPPFTIDTSAKWRVAGASGLLQNSCIQITKAPRLQVWGNDVRVGSSFGGGTNQASLIATNGGSWGEYGVIAPSLVTPGNSILAFGSAANKDSALLTFANSPLGVRGQYTNATGLGTIPDVQGYLTKAGNTEYRSQTHVDLHISSAGSLTIGATTLDTGSDISPVYVYTNATVTINGDIKNESNGGVLRQMVIIAKNIRITHDVKQIDAWLIATDTIDTCSDISPAVASSAIGANDGCGADDANDVLRINGPVMANTLLLKRTGGKDVDANSAAEVINLRGDAYIWMRKLSSLTGSVRTVYTRELAPRY